MLGFGVAYNSTRIALSERGRELATLRVLGFSRAETAYILLGEVAVLAAAALPLGCLLGWWLAGLMAAMFRTELYRDAADDRAVHVRRRGADRARRRGGLGGRGRAQHRQLDLIEVLKTRE